MSHNDANQFPIAALGASAGGLEAFEHFFQHMPGNAGIAFIVVQHLAPDHATALPDLLARYTTMRVVEARHGAKIAPNHVYIIPPNATLTVQNRILRVTPPKEARGHRMPIDSLFSSVAEDCGASAICIILSGTGTDGTNGLRAVKEHGGLAMAQTLDSAKYDSILRSAIGTGLVDHVLPVEEMPAKLLDYTAHLLLTNGRSTQIREQLGKHIDKIHAVLRRRVGHDFSQYKETTIVRRLSRRMTALQIETVEDYVRILEDQPDEAQRLFKDLLIGVTEFFRDPESFEALGSQVIPALFEDKSPEDPVRVCVVGCASGEEAYSLAILLSEYSCALEHPVKIKVFATDIDEHALEVARRGRYPESIAEHVSAARLERFFEKQDNAFQVKRELREHCIFTSHSLIKDPPFARQDLISCRNVMIYLEPPLQQKIIPLFHYALRPGGYLFLGPSDSTASQGELFDTVDQKHRILRRRESVRGKMPLPNLNLNRPGQSLGIQLDGEQSVSKQLERIILRRYRPSCAAVRENGDAVFFSGGIGRYLEPAVGSPDSNVISMARDGLRVPLRTALYRAVAGHERILEQQIVYQANGVTTHVDLTVEPIAEFQSPGLYMIVFEDVSPAPGAMPRPPFDSGSEETIRNLENELRSAREHSLAMFEELESSNEELRSANEEYHSTNEELEASKEEGQSINEELETVNAELTRRVSELDRVNGDLQNLNISTQIATIFLDAELRIKNFTPAAGSVFHLIAGDIGRPISDLVAQFAENDLLEDISDTLRTLATRERHLPRGAGQHYLARIMPYRTLNNVIDGVVITFTDITELKQAKNLADDARTYAENIVETVREPLLVLDPGLRVRSANNAFYRMFQVDASQTLNRPLYDLGNRHWDIPELGRLLDDVISRNRNLEGFRVIHEFGGVGIKVVLLNARRIDQHAGAAPLILLAIEDITAQSQAEDSLREANRDLQHFAYAASHDLQEPLRMVTAYTQLLAKELKGNISPKADQFIGFAVEGARRMEMLIKGLRDYWAVNDEKVEQSVVADCNGALQESLTLLDARIRESGAVITNDPLPTVRAEVLPLVLLFQNIIGNGLKYVGKGERPYIHVSVQRSEDQWHFSVRDNGIGIDDKYLGLIFSPFKRLHGQDYPGSGLGLAICQRIVERYKGRIWVESTVGKGSTFHFMLPP
jgi:two-component system CheB/CheR fusion protein